MQSKDIIDVLESKEAICFIRCHINDDLQMLSLKTSKNTTFNITVCLQLMSIYKSGRKKLPLFSEKLLAIDKRSYEQATSQAVALYKSTIIYGDSLLDITGGIGVDSLHFAKSFSRVTAVERNEELHMLALYNVQKLCLSNITRIYGNGASHISSDYDWLYIDPDRRVGTGRSVSLHFLEPNFLELLPLIRKSSTQVYIKLSPLFDIAEIWKSFDDASEVHVISERGEVKEVGVILDMRKKHLKRLVTLCDVFSGFKETYEWDKHWKLPIDENGEYDNVLLPHALVSKSSSASYFLSSVEASRHKEYNVYFSNATRIRGFRSFRIIKKMSGSVKIVKQILADEKISQVNIIIKGLKDKPAVWHAKLGTTDGGEYYLLVLKSKKSKIVLCKLISEK